MSLFKDKIYNNNTYLSPNLCKKSSSGTHVVYQTINIGYLFILYAKTRSLHMDSWLTLDSWVNPYPIIYLPYDDSDITLYSTVGSS